MSEVIFSELERGGDECFKWFKDRKELFVHPTSEAVEEEVRRLIHKHKNFGLVTGKNEGDPYVVALAIVENCVVVTNESMSNNPNGPKVPDVCLVEDISCIKFVEVIRRERVIFK